MYCSCNFLKNIFEKIKPIFTLQRPFLETGVLAKARNGFASQ